MGSDNKPLATQNGSLARSGLYFGIQIFIPLDLVSRGTFKSLVLQKLQLLGVLRPVPRMVASTALWLGAGSSLFPRHFQPAAC